MLSETVHPLTVRVTNVQVKTSRMDGVAMFRREKALGQHNATSGAQPCLASESPFVRGVRQCKEVPRLLSDHGKKMGGGSMGQCPRAFSVFKVTDKRWSEITTRILCLRATPLAPVTEKSLVNSLCISHTPQV